MNITADAILVTRINGKLVYPMHEYNSSEPFKPTIGRKFCTEEWYGYPEWIVTDTEKIADDKGRAVIKFVAKWADVSKDYDVKTFYAMCEEV